jgi:hypothetical protein
MVGKNLEGFTIQQYTEVYKTDVDGRSKTRSLGYFKDDSIAKCFAQNQTDAAYHETVQVYLLTDGKIGFLLGEEVELVDDEKAALEVRYAALGKLSPAERKVLGV